MPKKFISTFGEIGSTQSSVFALDSTDREPPEGPFYLNGYFEKYQTVNENRKLAFCKRPGTPRAEDTGLPALTGMTDNYKIQGMTSDFTRTNLIWFTNNGSANRVWHFDGTTLTDRGIAPAASGNWTNSGAVIFTVLDGISYGSNRYYAATDFTKGAVINSVGQWTEITDADFTGLSKVTNFCAMNGYLFIGTSNNRIYNSDLNDATAWDALSFLTAADTPGALMWLARIRNYLIAFKQDSIEFFEDTGNPTPGSPCTPQKQLNKKVGLASKSSVKEVSDGIIFLGISAKGKVQVYKLLKDDLSLKVISSQYIEQIASGHILSTAYAVDPNLSNSSGAESQVINYKGKEFYLITLSFSTAKRTYVYDNDLETWVVWSTCVSASNTLDDTFTPSQATMFQKGTTLYNVMAQNFLSDTSVPPYFVVITSLSGSFYDSAAAEGTTVTSYPIQWISDIDDYGASARKFIDSVEIIYDVFTRASNTTGTMKLYYSDNDYNAASTNSVVVSRELSYGNDSHKSYRPIARRLGSTRRRWYGLHIDGDINGLPIRIWGLEIMYNIGETDQEG